MAFWRRDILGLGLAAGMAPLAAAAQAPAAGAEAQDAWLDQAGRRHRMVFDTISVAGLGAGLNFARNFFTANQEGYGIAANEIGAVIIVRHMSTPFGFQDTLWAKYGDAIHERIKFQDPRDNSVPRSNLFNAAVKGGSLPNNGVLVGDLVKLGARFAVCGMAVARIAEIAAQRMGGKADDIRTEIRANLVPNAVLVPAGIVALNRAQEHGYTFSNCG